MSEHMTDEMRAAIDTRGANRLNAYYFGFDSTGNAHVDFILAAVAAAGKAYHSTEWWDEDDLHGFSYVELIQAAANTAAAEAEARGRAAGLREAAEIADEARADVTEVYPSNLGVIDQARGLGWQDGTTWVAAKIRARADEGER